MAINIFVPKFHTEEILTEIRECLDKGWTGLGFKTITFEEKWKEYTGLPYAHFLCSNTVGLHLAVHILKKTGDWKDGDEIITTPLTFVSTNHVILYEKLKPVFADIDEYLCLNPMSVESRISNKTRAIMFVGIGGNTGRLPEIAALCKKYNLKLILDAAHMAGTRINGEHAGKEADVLIYSFQAVKNLPSSDSGMICFKDKELDTLARQISWLGISKDTFQRFNKKESSYKWHYDVPQVGFKYHGNSIVASIALVQLKYLDKDNLRRNELAQLYIDNLKNEEKVKIVPIAPDCSSSRHLFQIRVRNRDEIMQYFYSNQIYPGVHYIDNTHYPMYQYASGTCPNAHRASDEIISLPLHLNLTDEDVEEVVRVLKEALSAK
jgi:dTDP-4-amino-4,6-dideoxygalactose transaminase